MINEKKLYISYWVIAGLSLYVGLFFPLRGEEGLYIASSFEALKQHHFLTIIFEGTHYGRPPLFNWLILGVGYIIGYKHMLVATRFISITMTLLSSLLLYWLTHTISRDQLLALFSVVCLLSGHLLFRASWISYADPTFFFFIFAAIVCMWVGHERHQPTWLIFSALSLMAAFLTKAFTCYTFYGITTLVLLYFYRQWRYFFHPISLLAHICALSFPFFWFEMVTHTHGARMTWDITHQFQLANFSWKIYIARWLSNSLTYILRFAPLSLLFIYGCITKQFEKTGHPIWLKVVFWSTVINFIPYSFTPGIYETRYLLPIFPFIAILFAFMFQHAKTKLYNFTIYTLCFFLAMKCLLSPIGLPWFEHMTYEFTPSAKKIIQQAQGYPIYVNLVGTAQDDSVVASLDTLLYPNSVIVLDTFRQSTPYFLLTDHLCPKNTQVAIYRIDKKMYNFCKITQQ